MVSQQTKTAMVRGCFTTAAPFSTGRVAGDSSDSTRGPGKRLAARWSRPDSGLLLRGRLSGPGRGGHRPPPGSPRECASGCPRCPTACGTCSPGTTSSAARCSPSVCAPSSASIAAGPVDAACTTGGARGDGDSALRRRAAPELPLLRAARSWFYLSAYEADILQCLPDVTIRRLTRSSEVEYETRTHGGR